MSDIIVGVDGSPSSIKALDWALERAELHGDVVVAVHAYRPTRPKDPLPHRLGYSGLRESTIRELVDVEQERADEQAQVERRAAEAVIDRALAATTADTDRAVIKRIALPRPAARALVELSSDAELLVLGHRGRGGFKGLRLGSVSRQCTDHARCTTVVVR